MKSRVVLACNTLPVLFIFSLPPAMAGNACRNILTSGFYHVYSRTSPALRDRAIYAELCASNYQMARKALAQIHQSGNASSFDVSPGLFTTAERGTHTSVEEFTQDQFNQWKSAYCATASFADSSRAAEFLVQEAIADPASPVVGAWHACMKNREGLACWATPPLSPGGDILLSVNWRRDTDSQAEVQHSSLSRGAISNFKGTPARRLLPAGHKLDNGTLEVPLTRLHDAGTVANLTVSQEGGEYSCNVYIPGEKDFVPPEPFVAQ
jgi:hypothetical protein